MFLLFIIFVQIIYPSLSSISQSKESTGDASETRISKTISPVIILSQN